MTVEFVSRAAPNCLAIGKKCPPHAMLHDHDTKPRRFESIQVSLDDNYRAANNVKCLGDS